MPDIVLYTLVSLDGATEDPHRYFPETGDRHGAPVFDDDLGRHEAQMLARQRAVLLGRRTYDQWSRYWPTSDEQPFADFINTVPKYVVTSTPLAAICARNTVCGLVGIVESAGVSHRWRHRQ